MSIEEQIEKANDKQGIIESLQLMMREAAENLDFERAAYLRDKIKDIMKNN